MATQLNNYFSPEEYLALEREAEYKSEYIDGCIYAMSGASWRHNQIVASIIIELGQQLRGRPCNVLPSDIRVRTPDARKFFYPDVSVVCGEPQFHDKRQDTILNPILIVEVLSDSTTSFDRAGKFFAYQRLPSLQAYVLAWQTEPLIEQYVKQSPDAWIYTKAAGRDTLLSLPSIECTLSLAAVYDKVSFENL